MASVIREPLPPIRSSASIFFFAVDMLDSAQEQVDAVREGVEVSQEDAFQHRSVADDWNQIYFVYEAVDPSALKTIAKDSKLARLNIFLSLSWVVFRFLYSHACMVWRSALPLTPPPPPLLLMPLLPCQDLNILRSPAALKQVQPSLKRDRSTIRSL